MIITLMQSGRCDRPWSGILLIKSNGGAFQFHCFIICHLIIASFIRSSGRAVY